jgi:hypothetical protein
MANAIKWAALQIKSTSHLNLLLEFDAELGKWCLMDNGRLVGRRKNIRSLMDAANELAKDPLTKEVAKVDKVLKPGKEKRESNLKAGKKEAKKAKMKKPKAKKETTLHVDPESAGFPDSPIESTEE